MTKNNNGKGRGSGPIDDDLSRQLRYARRKGKKGNAGVEVDNIGDELSGRLKAPAGGQGQSFKDKLNRMRAELGLPPLDLGNVDAKPEEKTGPKAVPRRPVKPENILPVEETTVAEPSLVSAPKSENPVKVNGKIPLVEVPNVDEILADIEAKVEESNGEKLLKSLEKEFALSPELIEVLRNKISSVEIIKPEVKQSVRSILSLLRHYIDEKDLLPDLKHQCSVLDFMLLHSKNNNYFLDEKELNLCFILRINDLSLDGEVERWHADRQRLEDQSKARVVENVTQVNSVEASASAPIKLDLSAPEDILAQAENNAQMNDDEITPELTLEDNGALQPLPQVEQRKAVFESKKFSEIVDNTMDDPLFIESSVGRFWAGTDKGFNYMGRNEDRVIVDTENNFFAVIDGVGGHGNGDVAAQVLAERLLSNLKTPEGIMQSFQETTNILVDKFGDKLHDESTTNKLPDACVVACKLEGNVLHIYQAGDVRVFIKGKDGNLRFNSFDQGLGNVVASTVSNVAREISYLKVDKVELLPGDQVMVMSDGVIDNFQDFNFQDLQLSPLVESALWQYFYYNGDWQILENEFGLEYKESYYDLFEKKIVPKLKEIYKKSSEKVSSLFTSDNVLLDYKKLAKLVETKMRSNDGKPDNRSLLVFEYQPNNIDVVQKVAEKSSVEEGKLTENIEKIGFTESTSTEILGGEDLKEISPKLIREYQYYVEQLKVVQLEILNLEDRNREINAWTSKQNEDWHNQDDKLKEYGDICREYTLNIQKLRDLDVKLSRLNILFNNLQSKVNALLSAKKLGLPLDELVEGFNKDEKLKNETKNLRLLMDNGKMTEVQIGVSEGRFFGRISTTDEYLSESMKRYVGEQRHFIKEGAKEISREDNDDIDKVLRLDFLSQYLDYTTLEDEMDEGGSLGEKLDQTYFEIYQRIANRYKILLPTRKAGISLYFEGNQARIPRKYLEELYLYQRKNNPTLKEKITEAKLTDQEAMAWIEAVLLGKVMRDSTISLAQLSGIKYRLNTILQVHGKLKNTWIPLKDSAEVSNWYPYLKVEKGWFQILPLEDLRKKMQEENIKFGIFEYLDKGKSFNIQAEKSLSTVKSLEGQEFVKNSFIKKLKEKVATLDYFTSEEKLDWFDALDYHITELLRTIDTPDEESMVEVLTRQRNHNKLSNPGLYQFYDGLLHLLEK